jgi:hypothetical protein
VGIGTTGHVVSKPKRLTFPTLRLRADIIVVFAVVVAISAASMVLPSFGFERVSVGVDSCPRQRVGGRFCQQYGS